MKTGLITFHSAHHYGAQLQAYALMKAVTRLGMDCEIIDYVRKDTVEGSSLFKKGLSLRNLLLNTHTLLRYGRLKTRFDRFESFKHGEMKLTKKFYGSYRELSEDAPEYDAYICGSDQIWNPLIFGEKTFDPAFFADFAKNGRRIAYAPSFGISEIPENNRAELVNYLNKFDALSVREKQGEKIISDLTGRESLTVLDPTFLLTAEEWAEVTSEPACGEPYLLCYFITDPKNYSGYVKAISEKYKLTIISLCGSRRVVSGTSRIVLDAGPREFLSLVKNAQYVLTDSFHGTAFSINFKKSFYSFVNAKKAVNSRIYNILEKLGLESRMIASDSDLKELTERLDNGKDTIDFEKAGNLLRLEREASLKYLENSLKIPTPDYVRTPGCR